MLLNLSDRGIWVIIDEPLPQDIILMCILLVIRKRPPCAILRVVVVQTRSLEEIFKLVRHYMVGLNISGRIHTGKEFQVIPKIAVREPLKFHIRRAFGRGVCTAGIRELRDELPDKLPCNCEARASDDTPCRPNRRVFPSDLACGKLRHHECR